MRSFFVIIALALCSVANAQTVVEPTIGALRLGMSHAEAREANSSVGSMRDASAPLRRSLRIGGIAFDAGLVFRDDRVSSIWLSDELSASDAASCFAAFDRVIAAIEPQVGALDGDVSPWPIGSTDTSANGSRIHRQQVERQRAIAYRSDGDLASATALFDTYYDEPCLLRVTLSRPLPPAVGEANVTQAELDAAPPLEHQRWIARPRPEAYTAAYPALAGDISLEGRVQLDCLIGADGNLRCLVASEAPVGFGFGRAALSLSAGFRSATDIDGEPTPGRRVQLPITFRMVFE